MFYILSPIEIFEINPILKTCKLFFNSASLEGFLTLSFFFITVILVSNKINPYKFNFSIDSWKNLYNFLLTIFKENLNDSPRCEKYYPVLFSLTIFIFILNITSLLFYDVSITSHLFMTLFLSFSFFFLFFVTALINFDKDFIIKFIEKDINFFLQILLFCIEVISFFIRPLSLGIRLFANMLSGHVLLHIFMSLFGYVYKNYLYLLWLPFIIIFLILTLEIFIAIIQTYVFIILLIIYLKDMYITHD